MAAEAYKTYSIRSPIGSHYRPATCAEVDCPAHTHGWTTTVDTDTPLGREQADYIRARAGRRFTEERLPGTLVAFRFPAGQRCFAAESHKVSLGRPEIYLVRGGDWRGNPRGDGVRRHVRPDDWIEDFGEHQQNLADRLRQG
jgi:hypothetical protein